MIRLLITMLVAAACGGETTTRQPALTAPPERSLARPIASGPPALAVATLDFARPVIAGRANTLVVRLANRGTGAALRVVATSRSSLVALHRHRFEFGTIMPGTEETRSVDVELPPGETPATATVVLFIEEASDAVPEPVSRRWTVEPPAPELTTHCVLRDDLTILRKVSAGAPIVVRCLVKHGGGPHVRALIRVRAPSIDMHSDAKLIDPSAPVVFEVPVYLPRDLIIGSTLALVVETTSDKTPPAELTLTAEITRPKLCIPGQLTRKQYDAKLGELRAAVKAGDMTPAQLDRYDAELVACLP